MSARKLDEPPPQAQPLPVLAGRLSYLLKHAQLRLADLTTAALAPFGITGRQCAVLIAIDDSTLLSQQEVARRMGVDRTTMVALIDELEGKELVQRQADPQDRRKNVVALTDVGATALRKVATATDDAERRFLGPVSDAEAASLKDALRTLAFAPAGQPASGRR